MEEDWFLFCQRFRNDEGSRRRIFYVSRGLQWSESRPNLLSISLAWRCIVFSLWIRIRVLYDRHEGDNKLAPCLLLCLLCFSSDYQRFGRFEGDDEGRLIALFEFAGRFVFFRCLLRSLAFFFLEIAGKGCYFLLLILFLILVHLRVCEMNFFPFKGLFVCKHSMYQAVVTNKVDALM